MDTGIFLFIPSALSQVTECQDPVSIGSAASFRSSSRQPPVPLRWQIIESAGLELAGVVASSDHCHCSRLCSVQASAFQCQINWECFLKVSGCLVPVSSAGCTLLTAVMRQIRTSPAAARHGHYSNTPTTDDSWRSLCCDPRVNGDSAQFRALMNIRAPCL